MVNLYFSKTMNREIIKHKVKGYGLKYSNPCPLSTKEEQKMVGNPKYCARGKCPHFKKYVNNKEGKLCVHCEYYG